MTSTEPTRAQPPALRYEPLIICTCSTSLHDTARNRAAHQDNHHCASRPASFRPVTRAEHETAGWGAQSYPVFITC